MKRGLIFVILSFVVLISSVNAAPRVLDYGDFPIEEFNINPELDLEVEIPRESVTSSSSSQAAVECGSTPVTGCIITQDTTFLPGTYHLGTGSGLNGMGEIKIAADNITLDCNGAILMGNSSYNSTWVNQTDGYDYNRSQGFEIGFYNNLVIKNCHMEYFDIGIGIAGQWSISETLPAPINITIVNNTFKNMSTYMIIASNVINLLIENNIFDTVDSGPIPWDSKTGIVIRGMDNLTIKKNRFINTGRGIFLIPSLYRNENSFYIQNNHFSHLKRGSLEFNNYASGLNNCTKPNCPIHIIENNIVENSSSGFTIRTQITNEAAGVCGKISDHYFHFNMILRNNTFFDGTGYGIAVAGFRDSENLEIVNNTMSDLLSYGIGIFGSDGVNVHDNTLTNVRNVGVYMGNYGLWYRCGTGSTFLNSHPNRNEINNNVISGSEVCGMLSYAHSGRGNDFYKNSITNNGDGICLDNSANSTVRENNLIDNSFSGVYLSQSLDNRIYLNNIYSNSLYNVESDFPTEVSYGGIGNYWGRSLPGPCFIPGIDSNTGNVNDSYAYCDGLPNNINIKIPTFGWYLFGSNLVPLDSSIETVLNPIAGHVGLVQSFVNGNTDQYQPGNPFNDLTGIYPWYGYWMKVTSTPPGDLMIIGNEVSPTGCSRLSLTTTPSSTHWVGYWASGVQPIATALSSITGNYSLVRTYENGGWKTYDPALPMFSDLDFMKPGQGYIITMTNSDDLNYLGGFCPP